MKDCVKATSMTIYKQPVQFYEVPTEDEAREIPDEVMAFWARALTSELSIFYLEEGLPVAVGIPHQGGEVC